MADVTQPPVPAKPSSCLAAARTATICLCHKGGRISAAARLYADGFAPVVVFSGGERSSETNRRSTPTRPHGWESRATRWSLSQRRNRRRTMVVRFAAGAAKGNTIGPETPLPWSPRPFTHAARCCRFREPVHACSRGEPVRDESGRASRQPRFRHGPGPGGQSVALTNTSPAISRPAKGMTTCCSGWRTGRLISSSDSGSGRIAALLNTEPRRLSFLKDFNSASLRLCVILRLRVSCDLPRDRHGFAHP